MTTHIKIVEHDPPRSFYDALARVFTEQENNGTAWVEFQVVGGVFVVVFKPLVGLMVGES